MPATSFATTPEGRFAYWEAPGSSPEAILLVHSLGTSKRLFEEMLPMLPPGPRIIVPDILGHGESSKPAHEFTVSDHARTLVALAASLGIARAHVMGTSLGALIGLEIAATSPKFTQTLTINGCPGWHLESQRMARLQNNSARLIGLDGLPRQVTAFGAVNRTEPDFVRALNEDLQAAGRWVVSSMWAVSAFDIMPRLGRITAPTLVLMGELDFHLPTVYQLHDGIAGSRLSIVPAAGHLTPYDDPAAVARELSQFIAENGEHE